MLAGGHYGLRKTNGHPGLSMSALEPLANDFGPECCCRPLLARTVEQSVLEFCRLSFAERTITRWCTEG
jgi:hypothetical protein